MAKKRKKQKKSIPPMMTLKVGPERYTVYIKDSLYDGSERLMGRVSYPRSEIQISKEYEPRKQRNTLFHEALHAVSDTYGIKLSEKQIGKLEVGLLSLLDDNPQLLAFEGVG
jgi:Zn-dependent peptidase ImmA (M78 family)